MVPAMIVPGMSGPLELLLIIVVLLLLFGPKRLPDLARSLGRSLSEFKKGRQEGKSRPNDVTEDNASDEAEPPDKKD